MDETTTVAPTESTTTTVAPVESTTTAPPSHTKDIVTGVFKGLLADDDDLGTCETDFLSAGLMLAAAVADLKDGKIVDVATDLSIALGKIEPAVADCTKVKTEVLKLLDEVKS